MKKCKHLVFGIIFLFILNIVLVGCGGSKDGPTQSQDLNAPIGEAKLTFKNYASPAAANDTFPDSKIGKIIKDNFGITFTILASSSDSNSNEMMNDLASGNVPDIFVCWASPANLAQLNTAQKAARENVLADISPYLEKDAPSINEVIKSEKMPIFLKSILFDESFGGKQYFLPVNYSLNEPWYSGWGIYIRDDVAKKINVTTPTVINSTEDLYNILVKIKNAGIKDTFGNDTYPLGLIQPWTQIMSALARPFDFGGSSKLGINDAGKAELFITTNYAKEQIKFIRKLLDEKLLDPESFTQKYEEGKKKIGWGKYAVTSSFTTGITPEYADQIKSLVDTNPAMEYKPLGNLKTHLGENTYVINRGMEASLLICISKKANVRAALKLMEYCVSRDGKAIVNMGIEGENWFWNSKGFAEMTKDTYNNVTKNTPGFIGGLGLNALGLFSRITGNDNQDYNIFGGNGTNAMYQNDPFKDNKVKKIVDDIMPNRKVIDKLNLSYIMQKYPKKDTIGPVISGIEETFLMCYLAKDDAEANKILEGYIQTLNKNGLQEYLSFVEKTYNENKDKYATYVTDVQ